MIELGTPAMLRVHTMRGLRWFGEGTCLAADVETGETHMVFRMLPGELARVVCVESGERGRRRYVAMEVLEPSIGRTRVDCDAWQQGCAGCGLLHVSRSHEQDYKRSLVAEVLQRFAGVSGTEVDWAGAGDPNGSGPFHEVAQVRRPTAARRRTRVRMVVTGDGLTLTFGAVDGSQVVVRTCGALMAELRRLVEAISGVKAAELELAEGAVCWWTAQVSERGEVALHSDDEGSRDWGPLLAARLGGLAGLAVDWVTDVPEWSTATDREPLKQSWLAGELAALREGGHSFGDVLDGTCGGGGTTLELARMAERVLALDVDIRAVRATAHRVAQAGMADRVEVRGGRLDTVLGRLVRDGVRMNGAVLNPMRRSLGDAAMHGVDGLGVAWLVYLAPAPRAAAADLAVLLARGWRLVRAAALDTHPGTARVMMGAVLERDPPGA